MGAPHEDDSHTHICGTLRCRLWRTCAVSTARRWPHRRPKWSLGLRGSWWAQPPRRCSLCWGEHDEGCGRLRRSSRRTQGASRRVGRGPLGRRRGRESERADLELLRLATWESPTGTALWEDDHRRCEVDIDGGERMRNQQSCSFRVDGMKPNAHCHMGVQRNHL